MVALYRSRPCAFIIDTVHVALVVVCAAIAASLALIAVYLLAFTASAVVTAARRSDRRSPEDELAAVLEADLARALEEILGLGAGSRSP